MVVLFVLVVDDLDGGSVCFGRKSGCLHLYFLRTNFGFSVIFLNRTF